jgi:hypothetical protein
VVGPQRVEGHDQHVLRRADRQQPIHEPRPQENDEQEPGGEGRCDEKDAAPHRRILKKKARGLAAPGFVRLRTSG